jgi:aerobic-type carbon monoxide dehydrogenase small subunit (CoxS/CutS family)
MQLHVNGKDHEVAVDPERSLLSVLRDELELTGAKYGCGEGECGACTVLIAGTATRSCITKISEVNGREVTTIESLARDGKLHPLQQSFIDQGAMQCGYCTCGMIMSAVELLAKKVSPSESEIVEFMDGNICRCGAYGRIKAAILKASQTMSEALR